MTRILIAALLSQGCSLKSYPTSDTGAEDLPWLGGQFQMTSQGVTDNCANGGFSALLIPEETSTPADWTHLTEFPAWEDMEGRVTYLIALVEPLSEMEVDVTQGDTAGTIEVTGGSREDIPLFDDGSCAVDLSVSATIQIVDSDNVTGTATMTLIDSVGQNCNFEQNCEVLLDFTGVKQ
jgi:hypothetical protein